MFLGIFLIVLMMNQTATTNKVLNMNDVSLFTENNMSSTPTVYWHLIVWTVCTFMILWSCLLILGFFGLVTINRTYTLIFIYGCILKLLVEFSLFIIFTSKPLIIKQITEKIILNLIESQVVFEDSFIIMDHIQSQLSCCGSDGPMNWNVSTNYKCLVNNTYQNQNTHNFCIIPSSCCFEKPYKCQIYYDSTRNPYPVYFNGCSDIIYNSIISKSVIIYVIHFVSSIYQIFTMFFRIKLYSLKMKSTKHYLIPQQLDSSITVKQLIEMNLYERI